MCRWPGYLDSCAGGAIPSGLTPFETMVKEAGEEASFDERILRKYARNVGAVSYFFQFVPVASIQYLRVSLTLCIVQNGSGMASA